MKLLKTAALCALALLFIDPGNAGYAAPKPKHKHGLSPADMLYRAVDTFVSQGDDERHTLMRTIDSLLRKGVSPNAANSCHTPPIIPASQWDHALPVLQLLLRFGADVDTVDSEGDTPLLSAVSREISWPGPDAETLRRLDLLIAHGADVNHRDRSGKTPLTAAMEPHHWWIVRLLLNRGANTDEKGENKYTPLHYAAFANDTTRVKALLRSGANVNARDSAGRTPLFFATEGGAIETIQALLDAGADVNASDDRNDFPLPEALRSESLDVALLLVKHGSKVNPVGPDGEVPLLGALSIRHPTAESDAVIGAMIERGVNTNDSRSGTTCLMAAVSREKLLRDEKHTNWVRVLLEHGADVNAKMQYGTALHEAIDRDRTDLAIPELLIAHGADIDAVVGSTNNEQLTPLLDSLTNDDFTLAALLVEKGAKVDCMDSVHKTPLLWAAYKGDFDLVKLLIAHKADTHARDTMGQDAVELAIKGSNPEIAAYIRSQQDSANRASK